MLTLAVLMITQLTEAARSEFDEFYRMNRQRDHVDRVWTGEGGS